MSSIHDHVTRKSAIEIALIYKACREQDFMMYLDMYKNLVPLSEILSLIHTKKQEENG